MRPVAREAGKTDGHEEGEETAFRPMLWEAAREAMCLIPVSMCVS